MQPDTDTLNKAVALLREGQVVAIPTETVYGLAGDARNPEALARIFSVKERPHFDPLILHSPSLEAVTEVVTDFPPTARRLAEKFWPGPLTLVLPKALWVPDLATSGLPSVAVRVPAHPVARELLQKFDGFLAAPSANRFGRISPTTAQAVNDELGGRIPLVLDGGPCQNGIESTIISFIEGQPRCVRLGALPVEEIEAVIGPVLTGPVADARIAPGNLASHYAPRKPLYIWDGSNTLPRGKRVGWLTFKTVKITGFTNVRCLSPTGDLVEAASRFFQTLRELDSSAVDIILAEPFPEQGLGRALNDRLRRASSRS